MAGFSLSFFDPKVLAKKTPYTRVACGSVYRALAVAMADCILSSQVAPQPRGLSLFLKLYEHHYSQSTAFALKGVETPFYRLKNYFQHYEASPEALLNEWAMTMFRLTMHGLQQHPTVYHEFALPPQRRDYPTYWIAKSAPAVAAHLLEWEFDVETSASGRPLYAKMRYQPNQTTRQGVPCSTLQERHGHYSAMVKNPQLSGCLLSPETQQYDDPVEIARLLPTLYRENQVILEKFQKAYRRLAAMVTAGEITKESLRQCYLSSVPQQRFHGTQAFFDSIQIQEEGHQAHMIPELIHAIARMISLGEMSETQVFQQMDTVLKVYG